MLTGKYMNGPPPVMDDNDRESAKRTMQNPRGRMDTVGWGGTLYRYRSAAALRAINEYAALAKG